MFAKDHSVIVISLARHDKGQNRTGPRRRLPWPQSGWTPQACEAPCCDDPESPPVMSATLGEQLAGCAADCSVIADQAKRHRVWLNCSPLPKPRIVVGVTR